jgi:hypothetical protein
MFGRVKLNLFEKQPRDHVLRLRGNLAKASRSLSFHNHLLLEKADESSSCQLATPRLAN